LDEFGFTHARPAREGRPPYHPGILLKLFIYGYLNRIRSSRALEKECRRNLELMWLLNELVPDHNTIANFRKDNLQAIKLVFRKMVMI
jgi:transposase